MLILCLQDDQALIVATVVEQTPATAFDSDGGSRELLFESVEGTEAFRDGRQQVTRWLSASAGARRCHHLPEHRVQPVSATVKGCLLGPVLDQGKVTALPRLGEFLFGFVQSVHVGQMVLSVVQRHGLCINVRLECLGRIRQRRQRMRSARRYRLEADGMCSSGIGGCGNNKAAQCGMLDERATIFHGEGCVVVSGRNSCYEVGRGRADSLYVLAAQEPLGLQDVFLAAKVARNALVQ